MKKIMAILLALCMLISLAACTNTAEPVGVSFTNGLNCSVESIYISAVDSEDWGEDIVDVLASYTNTTWFPQDTFGANEADVDIRIVDELSNEYLFYSVSVADGDAFAVFMNEEGKAELSLAGSEEMYIGELLTIAEEQQEDFSGVWELDGTDAYILMRENGVWEQIDKDGKTIDKGVYEESENGIVLSWLNSEENVELSLTADNSLANDTFGTMVYAFGFDSPEYEDLHALIVDNQVTDYFEQKGYEINYEFGDGEVYMNNGAFFVGYAEDDYDLNYYSAVPAYVCFDLDSREETDDGYVEIEFTKTIYLYADYYPDFVYEIEDCGPDFMDGMYDYYTGYILPLSSAYLNEELGEDYFTYEYESLGRTIDITYHITYDMEQWDDGTCVCTVQNYVKMPADYDGLVAAQCMSYSAAANLEAFMNLEEDIIGPMNDDDAIGALFCRVNVLEEVPAEEETTVEE